MNRIPERNRPLVVLAVGVVVLLLVAGGVMLVGGLNSSPSPTNQPSLSVTATASSDPTSTPEGAVRAMFEAYAKARPTNDASLVLPFVTSDSSPAYLSVRGFLEGQQALGRGAVITEQRFDDLAVETTQETATVTFSYVEMGYLIDIDSGEPLGSPAAIEPTRIMARVVLEGSKWLVEEYESTP
jgi:hypothetical protein